MFDQHSTETLVDSTGTVRRLRALAAMGHQPIPMAAYLAVSEAEVWEILDGHHTRLPEDVATFAAEMFSSLWGLRIDGAAGDQMRRLARERRWVGPLAWDDIDDVTEKPNRRGLLPLPSDEAGARGGNTKIDEIAVENAVLGEPVRLQHSERLVAIRRLHTLRKSDNEIAKILQISSKTVLRARKKLSLPPVTPAQNREAESA